MIPGPGIPQLSGISQHDMKGDNNRRADLHNSVIVSSCKKPVGHMLNTVDRGTEIKLMSIQIGPENSCHRVPMCFYAAVELFPGVGINSTER